MIINKKLVYFAVTITVVITFLFFIYFLFFNVSDNVINDNPTTITPLPTLTGYQGIVQLTPLPTHQKILEIDQKLLELRNKLPHKGKNFALFYQPENNSFILSLTKNTKEANKEFDDFLKKNGIENRSWLGNIYINIVDKLSI